MEIGPKQYWEEIFQILEVPIKALIKSKLSPKNTCMPKTCGIIEFWNLDSKENHNVTYKMCMIVSMNK